MSEVANLERQIEEHKEQVEAKERAERLFHNSDFRKLILDGFCRDECARYARQSTDPALDAENRADSLALAQASGHLLRWLSLQVQMGAIAERNLTECEKELDEARAEEGVH